MDAVKSGWREQLGGLGEGLAINGSAPQAVADLVGALGGAAAEGLRSIGTDELEALARGLRDAAAAGYSSPGLLAPLKAMVPEILALREAIPASSDQARPMYAIAAAFTGDRGIEGWLDEAALEERRSVFELLSHQAPGRRGQAFTNAAPAEGIEPDEAQWLLGGAPESEPHAGLGHTPKDTDLLLAAARGDASEAIVLCRSGARLDSIDRDGRGPIDLCWLSGKQEAAKELEAFASAKALDRAMKRASKSKASLSNR